MVFSSSLARSVSETTASASASNRCSHPLAIRYSQLPARHMPRSTRSSTQNPRMSKMNRTPHRRFRSQAITAAT